MTCTTISKIFVGPERLNGVVNFLNVNNFVQVPLINTFSKYDELLPNILNEIEDNCIFLFSCGLPSKSFIHKILERNNSVTCLDFGSGFDSMFVGHTREGQIDGNFIKNYYKNL
jgi:hypothetical protein